MAATSSPTDSNPPSAVPLPLSLPAPPPPTTSRRLPPPCWTPEETSALIDAYRDKWYSLGRTNLKAIHWQEVADAVTARCPNASPTNKTAVQCRHKMEKLRKRYRSEIQRIRSLPIPKSRSSSSWAHFKSMDSMEKGPSPPSPPSPLSPPPKLENHNHNYNHLNHRETLVDNDDLDDDDLYEELRSGAGNTRNLDKFYRNGSAGGGFRIRIPTGVSVAQPGSKFYGGHQQKMNMNMNINQSESGSRGGYINGGTRLVKEKIGLGKREREREVERERDPIGEMVNAIKFLRDGFVRMEQMKMEMAREIETMRMEMEMKRTEMILESQQRIVEAFAKAVSEKNKKRKLHKGNSNSNNNNIASPSES
ncbi:trihelix transcription factor ENAP1-like [Vicia villosa]|uniref:trihelix transcription factor ENAP1-like n=1 Tax=Vicia villosa TaxID=3911 RepID=UPI00273CC4F5|nr:trihelix transcription factor ENAP1-like [Vicia villosa]